MTTLREAATIAVQAYDAHEPLAVVMEDLRAALAEPQTWVCPDSAEHRYQKPGHCEDCGKTLVQVAEPVQEPVAWMDIDENGNRLTVRQWSDGNREEVPLYTAPPQRKPLTEIGDSNG